MDRIRAKTHDISDSEESDVETGNLPETSNQRVEDLFSGSDDLFDDIDDFGNIKSKTKDKYEGLPGTSNSLIPKNEKSCVNKQDQVYDADTDIDEPSVTVAEEGKKPLCKYGRKCYRKSPSHLESFYHPSSKNDHGHKRKREENRESDVNASPDKKPKNGAESPKVKSRLQTVFEEIKPFGFFLTKVSGIPKQFNDSGAMSLKDILSPEMGKLVLSCHFNFMFDVPWLVQQYSHSDRNHPILLVHGEQSRAEQDLKHEASPYPNISLCRAKLDIPYGTHHTKMMFLVYTTGLRVVIHTANLIPNDWHQKTQGIWISPIFPRLKSSSDHGDSRTKFKANLLQYMAAYKSTKLTAWEKIISEHNMSSANVHIVASVPGRHTMNDKHSWGHLKLKKVLLAGGPDHGLVKNWPVIGQFSSIGSLGANPDAWLLSEWGRSVSECKRTLAASASIPASKLHLLFPSKDNIRLSLEGYNGGGCVPYSIKTASKQPWLTPFFSQWKSEGRGRSRAVPHIKTYARSSPDGSEAAWFLVTSANLSKAAWGALEKKGSQLMIRSYELGVMFLPADFGCKSSFKVSSQIDRIKDPEDKVFPLPYDLPATTYVKGDRPWFCDVPCMDAPDTFGTMWCPPL